MNNIYCNESNYLFYLRYFNKKIMKNNVMDVYLNVFCKREIFKL